MVSPVNGSAIIVSWELLQARGGSIIHYIVWVRSLSDPSDIHIESVPSSATRTLISKLSKALTGLTHFCNIIYFTACAATYQVYVAAVSEEGVGIEIVAKTNTTTDGDCKGIGEFRWLEV